jgi:hypothetical protein
MSNAVRAELEREIKIMRKAEAMRWESDRFQPDAMTAREGHAALQLGALILSFKGLRVGAGGRLDQLQRPAAATEGEEIGDVSGASIRVNLPMIALEKRDRARRVGDDL